MKRLLLDACQLAGAVSLTTAGALLAPWVGFAVGGALLLAAGLLINDGSGDERT